MGWTDWYAAVVPCRVVGGEVPLGNRRSSQTGTLPVSGSGQHDLKPDVPSPSYIATIFPPHGQFLFSSLLLPATFIHHISFISVELAPTPRRSNFPLEQPEKQPPQSGHYFCELQAPPRPKRSTNPSAPRSIAFYPRNLLP